MHVPHISESIDYMWDDSYESDAALQSLNCRLRDINQKSLVLSGPHELQALHLNGQNVNQQGKWEILIPLLAPWQLASHPHFQQSIKANYQHQ